VWEKEPNENIEKIDFCSLIILKIDLTKKPRFLKGRFFVAFFSRTLFF